MQSFFLANIWLVKVLIILTISLLGIWFLSSLNKRLIPIFKKTHNVWDDSLLYAIYKPLKIFIWAWAVTLMLPILLEQLEVGSHYLPHVSRAREIIFVAMTLWFLMRYISTVERKMMESAPRGHKRRDKTTIRAITQLVRITTVVIALLVGLQTMGINIATLLAFGGVGTLAVGWAAKDTIANFIGGMMIFWDRPFSVGDWVSSPDRNIEGTVENIGWRLTRIRTFDKRPLYVPNGVFSTISVENPSRMTNRRIKTSIGVRYDDALKVGDITKAVKDMLLNHPEIDANQTCIVNLIEFGPSSLNFMVYTFTKTTNWVSYQEVQEDVFLKIIKIIDQHGAECAFPTTTLHVPEGLAIRNLHGETT